VLFALFFNIFIKNKKMKKYILLFFALIFIIKISKAQSWCPPNAEWYFTGNFAFSTGGYVKHTFTNTITINSLQCQKINYYSQRCSFPGYSILTTSKNYYTHFNNNVVYLYDTISNNFDTLFNYNAIIGSKWSLPNKSELNCNKARILVTDTGHNIIQGVNLKWFKVTVNTYFLTNTTPVLLYDTIYERIGCLYSYFYSKYDVCSPATDSDQGGALRCYSDNQISNYKKYSGACNYYFIPTVVNENKLQNAVKVYPNPIKDILNIQIENFVEPTKIQILNATGQLLKITFVSNQNPTIDTKELPNGIYFLQVFDKAILSGTTKFIKN